MTGRPNLFRFWEERYLEPFLGSGAVYFHIKPQRAVLSDMNKSLVATYRALRDDWLSVYIALKEHSLRHCKEYYYKIRDNDLALTPAEEAAKFIYLNRTCWNGLYRVNRNGQFNVPIGTKDSVLLESDDFASTAAILENAQINHCDFEETIDQALADDFLFVDPPYTVQHNLNGFIKYNQHLFSWEDQIRLRDALIRADLRGARILMTNADHESIRHLYQGVFHLESARRSSVLAGRGGVRGAVTELLIRNW